MCFFLNVVLDTHSLAKKEKSLVSGWPHTRDTCGNILLIWDGILVTFTMHTRRHTQIDYVATT